MEIEKLKNKKGKFSKAEIDFIIAEGAKYGINPPERTDCPDCWRDMAIQVAIASRPAPKGRRLWGRAAEHGVTFKGRLITNADLDEETLKWLDDNGFPQYLLRDAEG